MAEGSEKRSFWMEIRGVVIWGMVLLAFAATVLQIVGNLAAGSELDSNVLFSLVPTLFCVSGALVATRQPGNVVGWLMILIGAGVAVTGLIGEYLSSFDSPPPLPTPVLVVLLLLSGWSWLFLIYPIFHLLLVFPDGKLMSPRWRWLVGLEILMVTVFMVATAIGETLGLLDDTGEIDIWRIDNPIGFVPDEVVESLFGDLWSLGLVTLAIGGLTAVILRFRRSHGPERQQIKWLIYAFGLFALVYAFSAAESGDAFNNWIVDLLFGLSLLGIPVAMTVAILRYRLYDIDLVIRRTILYVILTGFLGVVYVGSVFLIRNLFGGLANSSLGVAVSTLLVAALFNPLRRRLQKVIDRRLFRTQYNHEQVVQRVASSLRDQADLDTLSTSLLSAVTETMQPQSRALWVKHA